eukprot:GHVL01039287.1.p1 GENE.GHVL01039287.1~~GHVL01039287.1.p1  ORF type:complete len:526 (+),score=99.67 GHVL01039287.1:162-1739(+)
MHLRGKGFATPPPEKVDLSDVNLSKTFPCLPGYKLPEQKENYRKPQVFKLRAGERVESSTERERDPANCMKLIRTERRPDPWRDGDTIPCSTAKDCFAKPPSPTEIVPAAIALDRQVLRFFGFFKEYICNSNVEDFRIHRIVLYYYLEDDTLQVSEPKVVNSGIPQGLIIRRHRFLTDDGHSYMTPEGFRVGTTVTLYAKDFFLTDCDDFTRKWYSDLYQVEQDPSIEIPEDAYDKLREQIRLKKSVLPSCDEKKFKETVLGGVGYCNKELKEFLIRDRQVLRFYACYDNLLAQQFERRRFQLLFYLSDRSVEVRENFCRNSGMFEFPVFLKRQKLLKGRPKPVGPTDTLPTPKDFVTPDDLLIGKRIPILSHELFIYDADPYTRQYYKNERNIDLKPPIDVKDIGSYARIDFSQPPPPPTGYGNEEDSMGSVKSLNPKAPKKDFQKFMENDKRVLRIKMRLEEAVGDDANRDFLGTFHLDDDTITIYEQCQRNAGRQGGKFLERGKYTNALNLSPIDATQLTVG